ncbi:putative metabolite transport protein YfiG [Colletotrichum shisoi]|uniref:Putative metabolite transport protein YfiG n=1 Tax=Colletotrichum shisoi TaxID=2078593 RepID=A0A5Q4C823_9PEZI|nr:putative metabolite transport protein YfiG [Colletotrichum shisoi]
MADDKHVGAMPPGDFSASNIEKARRGSQATVDLNANVDAKIRNPLLGISRAELIRDVDAFAHEKGLQEYIPVLRKGALVAQDPTGFEEIDGDEALNQAEIQVLHDEVLHKWRVPKILYLTIITCSIGAAVQGWDQTGSNGANLSFPTVFGIGGTSHHDTLLVGLVNSAPYIGSAFIGCWLSDPLNNFLGRRGAIFFAANFCLWPVLGSAFAQSWEQLLACRLLLGIGMGAKASTVPIFAAENSPAPIRGALVMTWQMWTAFGIMAGTAANLAVAKTGAIAWRLQLGSAFIPAVPLALLIYACPESPRWYIKKNRYPDAMKSLLRLRNHPIQAARDIYYIHSQLQVEAEIIGRSNYAKRFLDLFTIPRVRRATLASFTVMIAQQMCGINIIAFYSSTIFKEAGTSEFNALLASFGFGMMAWTLLAAGLCTLIPGTGGAHLGMVALFVYLFAAFYSPGEGPVPSTYSAEVFPLSHREVGMSWAVATCLFWAAVLSITFPIMLADIGVIGSFCFYAGLNVVAFVMIFLWLPETKQRTLEELDYIFAVPTRVFMRYQIREALPYWFKRWVLFRRDATLEPLYKFDLTHEDHHGSETYEKAQVEQRDKKSGSATGVDVTSS